VYTAVVIVNTNEIVQSNLGTGRVGTSDGTIGQLYLPDGANMHAYLIHDSLGPFY